MLKTVLTFIACFVFASVVIAKGDDLDGDAVRRGNDAYARGQYEAAISEYRQVSRLGEHYAEAEYNIGVCYHEMGKLSDALVHYTTAIKARRGRYANALYAEGVVLEELDRRDEAKEAYARAIESRDGPHVGALFKLGFMNQREGKHPAAENLYRRALALSRQRFPACHNNLGVVLALEGRYNDAEREFAAAIRDSKGKFEDARLNLDLCRQLMVTESRALLARLVSTDDQRTARQ